jgi:hypothetical protein
MVVRMENNPEAESGRGIEGSDRRSSLLGIAGLVLLAATKASDLVTTAVGLSSPGLVEANVFVRHAMASWGTVEALVVLGGVSVVGSVVVVEWGAGVVADQGSFPGPELLQGAGYGSLAAVYLAATARNVALLVETGAVGVGVFS